MLETRSQLGNYFQNYFFDKYFFVIQYEVAISLILFKTIVQIFLWILQEKLKTGQNLDKKWKKCKKKIPNPWWREDWWIVVRKVEDVGDMGW